MDCESIQLPRHKPLPWSYVPAPRPRDAGQAIFSVANASRNSLLASGRNGFVSPTEIQSLKTVEEFPCTSRGCDQVFTSVTAFETHHRAAHQNVCSVCSRVLPSARLLNMHILECHDTLFPMLAERKPMYECFVDGCQDKFMSRKVRKEHLINQHHYPDNFPFGEVIGRIRSKPKKKDSPAKSGSTENTIQRTTMEVDDGISEIVAKMPTMLSFGRRGRGRGRGSARGSNYGKKKGGRGRGTLVCYRCKQQGHISKHCKNEMLEAKPNMETD